LRHYNLSNLDAKTLSVPILRCAETSANNQTFTLIPKSTLPDAGPDHATNRSGAHRIATFSHRIVHQITAAR
jgi:hypothetical protein